MQQTEVKVSKRIEKILKDKVTEHNKDNPKYRMVIDYRALNAQIVPSRWPLPSVPMMMDSLKGSTVFSCMDALWGFWQIPMHEETFIHHSHSRHCVYQVLVPRLLRRCDTWMMPLNQMQDQVHDCVHPSYASLCHNSICVRPSRVQQTYSSNPSGVLPLYFSLCHNKCSYLVSVGDAARG